MNIGFKKIITSLLTLSVTCSLFTGVTLTTKAATNVTVNLSSKKQLIRGFGGINVPGWVGDLTATQRETAFGNGVNQLGFSILRIFVDGNKNNWYKELPTAKSAIANGALVFASPWNPPSDMTETFTRNGVTGQKRLRYDKYAAYAQHLNDFVSYMKTNGVNLYSISVQNEPDYASEWTWWTPQEMLTFMKNNAGTINCKVMGPESFSYLKNMSDPILNDPQALANMDILGTHTYGTSVSNFAYPLFKQKGAGKELWMTEVYVPNSDAGSADRWPEALDVAKHMNDAMVEGDFQAYVWWYIRRQYGPMKEDGNISKRGFMMAHFSKFVRPGYVRVDATKNPATNVYASAYTGANKVVIIAINKGTSQVSQSFSVQNGATSSVSSWVTSATLSMAKSNTNINIANGNFTASLPAQSVTTFVVDMTGTTPTPVPTIKPTATPVVTPKPTTTPVATPAPTTTTGNIQIKMFNGTTSTLSNTISPKLLLTNTGSSAINLSNVKIRYYYTSDGEQAQNFWCDWSTIGATNVTGKAVKMTTAKTTANYYLELGFTSTAGSLNPGSSIEIQGRLCKADWSNYTQTNDYSFNSTATTYTASNKITAAISNYLKFGIEP